MSQATDSRLGNISTRAFVSTGSDIVIAGFILGGGMNDDRILVRGIGPSLTSLGLAGALPDPTLELRSQNGTILISDDNWQDDPAQALILASIGLAPSHPLESAIVADLPTTSYTVILAGLHQSTGIGLVEVYDNPAGGPTPTPGPPSLATAPTFKQR